MSDQSIIKEFLVALGVKQDEAGIQKFEANIAGMTKLTLGLGAALESMAATAMFAAQRIAMSYSNLQTESRNVGASAENIKTYTYAVSQLGGTVEEALGSIKSFGTFLKESPGNVAWVESFTGSIRNAKGQLIDTTEALDKFLNSDRFRNAQDWQKRQFIHKAGIDINTWQALTSPQSREFLEESRRVNQNYGLDPDKLAKQGREFTQEWQAIWMRIRAIRDRFLMGLGFEDSLKKFKDYLDQNKDQINQNLETFVEKVKPLIKAFGEVAGKIIEVAGAIVKYLGPDTTAWIVVAALVNHFTGMGTAVGLLATRLIPALGASLAGLMVGPSGAALKAIAGIAALAGLMSYFNLDASPDALRRGHKNENWTGHKHDDGDSEDTYGSSAERMRRGEAPPAKKKSLWERGKQWFNDKIGIAPAEGRETEEGQKGGETPASTPLLDTISKAEGTAGRGDYNAVLGYGKYGSPDKPLTDMTLAEAYAFGRTVRARHGSSSAIGRYQIVGTTMKAAARGLGLDWNKDRFDAATQDRMAMWIARKQGLDAWEGFKFHPELRARARQHMHQAAAAAAQQTVREAADAATEQHVSAARRMADARRAARQRPEVEPQTPVHIPERRRTREDEQLDNRPQYDYSKPGAPLVTPRARHDGGTGIAHPGGVSPRTPIGHVSSSSIRHGDATVNAKTTINVTTPGDPGAAARAVAGAQNNVNADLIRNMRGASR